MSKKDYTHLVLILDGSKGFAKSQASMLKAVNSFMANQDQAGKSTTMTLVLFNGGLEYVAEEKTIGDIKRLTRDRYVPRNQSAILDTLGSCILSTQIFIDALTEEEIPEAVVFLLITDGKDTASTVYPVRDLRDNIKDSIDKDAWEFVFMCANEDAQEMGEKLGIPKESSIPFKLNEPDILSTIHKVSVAITAYRNVETEHVNLYLEEGAEASS